jgi:hypothetical protein
MMMSQRFKASMLNASCRVVSFLGLVRGPCRLRSRWRRTMVRSDRSLFPSTMRSINTEPTMPRQPTKPTNLLISTPFQSKKQCQTRLFCPGSSGQGGRTTIPELDQPLIMVVVLVVIARAAARRPGRRIAVFRANGRATNMAQIVAGLRALAPADGVGVLRKSRLCNEKGRHTAALDKCPGKPGGRFRRAPSPRHRPSARCPPWWCLRCRCRACAALAPAPFAQRLRCAGRLLPGSG